VVEIRSSEPVPLEVWEDGVIRVTGTRVQFDIIIDDYERGDSPEYIAKSYTTVSLADVYLVIGYYLRHKDELKPYLDWRVAETERVRKEIESRWPSEGIRERLLARRRASDSLAS
jgi:uncharacterized protein (DUF433 family)